MARLVPATYDTAFLQCRDLRHGWDAKRATFENPRPGVLLRSLPCTRCGVVRDEYISTKTWLTLSRSYRYPKGYHLEGRIPTAAVKYASIQRMKGKS